MIYKKLPFSDIKELLATIFISDSPVEIVPDAIHKAALASGIELVWTPSPWWNKFEQDMLSHQEILYLLFTDHKPMRGEVIIITDECFTEKKGYVLPVGGLSDFVENIYPEIYQMDFFQPADIIFIFPQDRIITIMFHEGYQMQYNWSI